MLHVYTCIHKPGDDEQSQIHIHVHVCRFSQFSGRCLKHSPRSTYVCMQHDMHYIYRIYHARRPHLSSITRLCYKHKESFTDVLTTSSEWVFTLNHQTNLHVDVHEYDSRHRVCPLLGVHMRIMPLATVDGHYVYITLMRLAIRHFLSHWPTSKLLLKDLLTTAFKTTTCPTL